MGEHESEVSSSSSSNNNNNNNNTCTNVSRQNPFTCTQTSIS
jgi:hypothetical protein